MSAQIVSNMDRYPVENVPHLFHILSAFGFNTVGAGDQLWPRIAEGKRRDG